MRHQVWFARIAANAGERFGSSSRKPPPGVHCGRETVSKFWPDTRAEAEERQLDLIVGNVDVVVLARYMQAVGLG
jgi:hypothetical protein